MKIKYRPGEKKDSRTIAELIDMASDGVAEYLFHGLVPGMSPVQVIANNLENDYYPHSYKSTFVAEENNTVVGMALSYPSEYHKITDGMRNFFPKDRLDHLHHFYSCRVENSWYLDALGVVESYRRRGIGEKLISLTKEKATEGGFDALSLIVFSDNVGALSLYEHFGFKIDKKVELKRNEYIKHDKGCLLLKCDISP